MRLKTFTVSEINNYLANYVSENPIFGMLSVTGEVIDYKKTNYGYSFFSLKDEKSRIRAMIYDDNIGQVQLKDGDVLVANGRLSFYSRYGTYTYLVNKFEKKGTGSNFEQFAKLYKELSILGYFEESLKKDLPKYPDAIGVVTSSTGAALQDIISVIKRRYPKVTLLVSHAKMQGENMDEEVSTSIRQLDDMGVDVIILSRGGGDADDLAAFNSRLIADSIYDCDAPVVSAIGHEIDFCIADFVSDKRASTPSIAAEISVPELDQVYKDILDAKNEIEQSYIRVIQGHKMTLANLEKSIKLASPSNKIYEKKMEILDLKSLINSHFTAALYSQKARLAEIDRVLISSDYSKVMEKGFSIVKKDGTVVKSSEDLLLDDELVIEFKTGKAKTKVTKLF